jgi:glutamate racemase
MPDSRPIGVFDSGVGGLTVARAILDLLPNEPMIYVGDSARYPYGPRPLEEIRRFALEIAGDLVRRDVKMIVVACNSVEVVAITDVAAAHDIPVIGVVDPGSRAAVRATRNGRIGVIGTVATIASKAYDRAVLRMGALAQELGHPAFDRDGVELFSQACPVFVERVEVGDTSSKELQEAAVEYLTPLKEAGVDTLILGCTHYPLLSGLIQVVMGPDVLLISSAEETAKDVYAGLLRDDLLANANPSEPPRHEFLTTGDPEAFRELGRRFLGPEIAGVGKAES